MSFHFSCFCVALFLKTSVHVTKWVYKQFIRHMAYFTLYAFIFSCGQLFFGLMESPGPWL